LTITIRPTLGQLRPHGESTTVDAIKQHLSGVTRTIGVTVTARRTATGRILLTKGEHLTTWSNIHPVRQIHLYINSANIQRPKGP
jgi:hypothetical protein